MGTGSHHAGQLWECLGPVGAGGCHDREKVVACQKIHGVFAFVAGTVLTTHRVSATAEQCLQHSIEACFLPPFGWRMNGKTLGLGINTAAAIMIFTLPKKGQRIK